MLGVDFPISHTSDFATHLLTSAGRRALANLVLGPWT